jgi:glycosyltransferase involved in cell wall biosynthesis
MSPETDSVTARPESPISVELSPTNIHSSIANLVFLVKSIGLQLQRGWKNWHDTDLDRWSQPSQPNLDANHLQICAQSQTDLWIGATAAEWILQAGKIHNLRLAIRAIDGIEIPAGKIFSFWQQVGKPSASRGFVAGRELRQGCIIPNIGGGLCQLSNALYDAALQANLEIIERYRHSQIIPGSLAEIDRDATVFWNYIDLKFRSSVDLRIEAMMDDTQLIVRFKTAKPIEQIIVPTDISPLAAGKINSCLACNVTSCFRHQSSDQQLRSRTAYLVDDVWAEFDRYLQTVRTDRDQLYLPIDGQRFRKSNYAWHITGFDRIHQDWLFVISRAYQSRKLAKQGAARQQMLMAQSRRLALNYGKSLTPDITHLVITQNLLPWLWEAGYLGGRTFDVLMTSLPIVQLQSRLDQAYQLHPDSSTLGDFRTPDHLAQWELAAFDRARKLITPHADLARLWPDRTELLDWVIPSKIQISSINHSAQKPTIVLPSSSLGRKGIYELREAITGLNMDVNLIIAGSNIEDSEFWQGYPVFFEPNYLLALSQADLVVLPAWVEHQPRRILQAVAAGIPAIVSTACGLHSLPTVKAIEYGDSQSLKQEIIANLTSCDRHASKVAHQN